MRQNVLKELHGNSRATNYLDTHIRTHTHTHAHTHTHTHTHNNRD